MNGNIVKIRERLVELSKDPIETRELLDKLTEQEIDKSNLESVFHIGKNDIEETKDFKFYKIHKTKNGYVLHYHGGYTVCVDDGLISTATALQQIMDGVPADASDVINPETGLSEKAGIELMLSAAEMIFRLPLFVLSHEATTLNIATLGLKYITLLQTLGEVPTAETENPEYDKFLAQTSEFLDNVATAFEKEHQEYEKRMGIETPKSETEETQPRN